MEILQQRFFPASRGSATSWLVEDPKRYVRTYTHLHAYKKEHSHVEYDDVECRYHRARMSNGITSRGDILLCVGAGLPFCLRSRAPLLILLLLLRLRLRAARRLKGYKRTDPCVSPLFPLIFLLENPQSVRSGG